MENEFPVPDPRRSDEAFARAVIDDVRRRRSRAWIIAPAFAAAVAGVALLVTTLPADPPAADLYEMDDGDSLFALPGLEGSTDEELERLERALDDAIAQQQKL